MNGWHVLEKNPDDFPRAFWAAELTLDDGKRRYVTHGFYALCDEWIEEAPYMDERRTIQNAKVVAWRYHNLEPYRDGDTSEPISDRTYIRYGAVSDFLTKIKGDVGDCFDLDKYLAMLKEISEEQGNSINGVGRK